MSLAALLVRPVTIVHPVVAEDRNGARQVSWSGATTTTSRGWLSQVDASEDIVHRDGELTRWVLFLPAGTDITAQDRVTIDGATFEVDAPPHPAWSPRGEHHLEVQLRRMEG